jgi:hypothetical protein
MRKESVAMLETTLRKAIPSKLSSFSKLTEGHSPYFFDKWGEEKGNTILRYWFWNEDQTKKNKKRVFINEIESLLQNSLSASEITRPAYIAHCPRTNGDGSCGFAVIIRILEYFQVVKIINKTYRIKNIDAIKDLLA